MIKTNHNYHIILLFSISVENQGIIECHVWSFSGYGKLTPLDCLFNAEFTVVIKLIISDMN